MAYALPAVALVLADPHAAIAIERSVGNPESDGHRHHSFVVGDQRTVERDGAGVAPLVGSKAGDCSLMANLYR